MNRAGAEILGWNTKQVLGIDSEVLWPADGSWFHAEYSSYPVLDAGVVQGVVVTFVDITERKLADEPLREARDELEQRVAARTLYAVRPELMSA